ncbi:MAG: hypothetical protein RL563_1305, partial [Pseudomonadota bacterium]
GRIETIFASLQNIAPSQMLDPGLFDFAGLRVDPEVANSPRVVSDEPGLDILER